MKTAEAANARTARAYSRWITGTVLLAISLCAITACFNWREDQLGLFGRQNVSIYALDRFSTYAMSYRYIPEHFDGLLVGNSLTTNWDTSKIPGFKVFNCSIRGGNFSEEYLIAKNVMLRGRPKMIVILIHPSFTSSHGRLTPYMTGEEYWSSLGSVQTSTIYLQMILERLAGPDTRRWTFQHRAFPFGGQNFKLPEMNGPADEPAREFFVDPQAEQELKALISLAHDRKIKLFFLIPPVYRERWQINKDQITAYNQRLLKLKSSQDTLINLNDGSLALLTQSHTSFPDYTHLTLEAASQASDLLAKRIASSYK